MTEETACSGDGRRQTTSASSACEAGSRGERFESIFERALARRSLLKGAAAAFPIMAFGAPVLLDSGPAEAGPPVSLGFTPISLSTLDEVIVPEGYKAEVVIRWGDPLISGLPAFDVNNQTVGDQSNQFGFNCDFLGYFPLPGPAEGNSRHGLLAVNHEYTTGIDMFPGYIAGAPTAEQVEVEWAAHGISVVEIKRNVDGSWSYVVDSPFNRRITATTEIEITGPAAGHPLMQTSSGPTGAVVLGTLNNCGGGKTPWGTSLHAEENFDQYFANNDLADPAIRAAHERYGLRSGATQRRWENFDDRFDVAEEPHEPFRFGWVVEVDPYDPLAAPRKRTALGRFKHEAATVAIAKDRRVVVYSGDDTTFNYLYKFVSEGAYTPQRAENADLLDSGTLYVVKFHDDFTGEWLPLVYSDSGPLNAASGFADQGEVLIKTRQAADVLEATPMDRPEDVETNPKNGKVYFVLTNNGSRKTTGTAGSQLVDAANPRGPNNYGHIIEISEDDEDPAALTFKWDIFILCGNPATQGLITDPSAIAPDAIGSQTYFAGFADAAAISPIAAPDNIAFDKKGNLWIATDGQPSSVRFKKNDGVFAVATEGPTCGQVRQFLSGPAGCEICGPEFTPNNTTFFCAVQHPGEDGGLPNTLSTWPDGTDVAPRPSVVAIWRHDGGAVGS